MFGCCRLAAASSLGVESLDKFLTGEVAVQEHFHGYDTVEADLARPKHHAHTAATDFLQQFVIAEIAHLRSRNDLRHAPGGTGLQ